jgi:RNA polymerase sigma-70 factor (ECF subfamily)
MYPEAGRDLVERARHDRAAFGEIYDLYVRRVYAFCLSRCKDRFVAEDLTSQTFERALATIERYEQRGAPLSSWLLRIAANLIADRGRQQNRLVFVGDAALPEVDPGRPAEPRPEEWIEQWERAGRLRDHIATLPPDQQRVLKLRYWDGHAISEVAEQMGRNENATKQLLHRAMTNLRGRVGAGNLSDV